MSQKRKTDGSSHSNHMPSGRRKLTMDRIMRPFVASSWMRKGNREILIAALLFSAILTFMSNQSFRNLSNDVICQSNPTMLFGIFTMDSEWETRRRQVVREIFQSIEDPRICGFNQFLSGDNPCCIISYTFVMGGGDENAPTEYPNDSTPLLLDQNDIPMYSHLAQETDIIFLNIRENMNDGKSFSWLTYITSIEKEYSNNSAKIRRSIDYVAKVDTDAVVNLPVVLDLLQDSLLPGSDDPNIFGGFMREVPYKGNSVNAVGGPFYFFSIDLACYIVQTLSIEDRAEIMKPYLEEDSRAFHNEDVAVSIIAHSNPKPISLKNVALIWDHAKEEDLFRLLWSQFQNKIG